MSDLPCLEIIHEHEFEEQLAALVPDVEQADEFTAAAEDLLSRLPWSGLPASRDGLVWGLPMSPVGGRQVTLYYTFDDHSVTLLWIVTS